MTRPVPLFDAPELLTLLEPHPLTDEAGIHGRYLRNTLTGDTLIVAQDNARLDRLKDLATSIDAVTDVQTSLNDTASTDAINAHDLDVEGQSFDTIVYAKERTAWFGRSPDFQRLTDHLTTGGTLLAKTKWVPDSKYLDLEEIAVANAFAFDSPHVYLRFTATQASLTDASFGASPEPEGDSGASHPSCRDPIPRALASDVQTHRSQFPADAQQTEFTPGWSWHTALQDHVEAQLEDVDGVVANLCCGISDLGDIRLDLFTDWTDPADSEATYPTAATVQGDATTVPLETNSVAAVVTDPPWKIPPRRRVEFFSEAVRVTEPAGTVTTNALWIPHHPYARLTTLRPVVANVTDTSLNGPGGLSFLATYTVAEHPRHADTPYTLSDHLDRHGIDQLDAYRRWGRRPAPEDAPMNDPRIVGTPHQCHICETPQHHTPRSVDGTPLYECPSCGFRHTAGDLLEHNIDRRPVETVASRE
jgi:hypothetical protein